VFPLINIAEETRLRPDIGSSFEIEEASDSDQGQEVELGMVTARLSEDLNDKPLLKMKTILDLGLERQNRFEEPINYLLSQFAESE